MQVSCLRRGLIPRGLLILSAAIGTLLTQTSSAQEQEAAPAPRSSLPSHIDPNEIRRGIPMGGVGKKSRTQLYYERTIRKIEPNLRGKPERLPQYIELFKREMAGDTRLFPFDVQGEWEEDGKVRLKGFVGFEQNRAALLQFVQYLGFEEVEDRIEVLPSRRLGERLFGFVKVPHCFTYDRSDGRREPMTECLLGDPVYLLKEADAGFFLCQSAEGYVGYIDGNNVRRVNRQEFTRYHSGPQVYLLRDCEAEGLYVPIGVRLKWVRNEGDRVVAELPGGREIALPRNQVEIRRNAPSDRIERIIEIASQNLGAKYVWGGKTSQGIDCSGLIQSAFKAEGINLPRDAYQQAYLGSLVATRWYRDGLRRGDTLYFLGRSGKINHTAIYLGGGQYLEASGADVHYSSFNPADENYSERKDASFCFAKRLLE